MPATAQVPALANPPLPVDARAGGEEKEQFPWLIVAAMACAVIGLLVWKTQSQLSPQASSEGDSAKPIEPEMVFIKAGSFPMGSLDNPENQAYSDERRHQVQVGDFYLGKYEVTFAEYDRFAQATGRPLPDDGGHGRGAYPVNRVSWEDAQAYAQWLGQQTGKHYRLPTEAEWEYAARAGTAGARFWGDGFDLAVACRYASYMECPKAPAHAVRVGSFRPNPWGLHDMLGNVLELTASAYDEDYQGGEQREALPEDGKGRVMRGGSWYQDASSLRSAWRGRTDTNTPHNLVGFRLARD